MVKGTSRSPKAKQSTHHSTEGPRLVSFIFLLELADLPIISLLCVQRFIYYYVPLLPKPQPFAFLKTKFHFLQPCAHRVLPHLGTVLKVTVEESPGNAGTQL